MTFTSQNIGISIERSADEVYEFASNPENLPKWASGLGDIGEKIHGAWIADSPMGKITITFAEKNKFGILDHDVTLATGEKFYNPMRVFPNNDGCEVVFTLYRLPNVTDLQLMEDAKTVEKDLQKLKTILEK